MGSTVVVGDCPTRVNDELGKTLEKRRIQALLASECHPQVVRPQAHLLADEVQSKGFSPRAKARRKEKTWRCES
jgi:hypothetical protein